MRQYARKYAGHLLRGRDAEHRARQYLERRGLDCIETNYRCKPGEIDLIMREGSTVVFVEVRYRKDQSFGGALESIDARKQRRLRAAAEHYLQRHRAARAVPCRFDVVLVSGAPAHSPDGGGALRIDWIPNAL